MKRIQIDFQHFWPGYDLDHFLERHPFLSGRYRFEQSSSPDVLFYSCFVGGRKRRTPPLVQSDALKVFMTAECVRPDMLSCDYAFSFCRDIDDPRHTRFPNYLSALWIHGRDPEELVRGDTPSDSVQRPKFCAFVQHNDVLYRNAFVERLSRYKRVDCYGRSLHNMGRNFQPGAGHPSDRRDKYDFYRQYKFVVCFENEASPGYTTEKLPDAMISRCVPIYWGDPDVGIDFQPNSFVQVGDSASIEEAVERIVALDQDDAAYNQVANQPYFHGNAVPEACQQDWLASRFETIFEEVGEAPVRAVVGDGPAVAEPRSAPVQKPAQSAPVMTHAAKRDLSVAPTGFHGDRYLQRLVAGLVDRVEVFIETGTNTGGTLGWMSREWPDLQALSCEPDPQAAAQARRSAPHPNVSIFEESSQDFLIRLRREYSKLFDKPAMFWLDAHGYGFQWPLLDEIAVVMTSFSNAYVLIDDFRVPDRPEFKFDAYQNQECSMDYIRDAIPCGVTYRLYYPAYVEHTSGHHPLTGWGLLQVGDACTWRIDEAFPGVVRLAEERQGRPRGSSSPASGIPEWAPAEADAVQSLKFAIAEVLGVTNGFVATGRGQQDAWMAMNRSI